MLAHPSINNMGSFLTGIIVYLLFLSLVFCILLSPAFFNAFLLFLFVHNHITIPQMYDMHFYIIVKGLTVVSLLVYTNTLARVVICITTS